MVDSVGVTFISQESFSEAGKGVLVSSDTQDRTVPKFRSCIESNFWGYISVSDAVRSFTRNAICAVVLKIEFPFLATRTSHWIRAELH